MNKAVIFSDDSGAFSLRVNRDTAVPVEVDLDGSTQQEPGMFRLRPTSAEPGTPSKVVLAIN